MDSQQKKTRRVPKGHKRLTIEDRVKILTHLENGEKPVNLASEFGISVSSISHIKKDAENILEKQKAICEHGGKMTKKRCTGIEGTRCDEALHTWFHLTRNMSNPISGPLLQQKASQFNCALNGPMNFKASAGFLHGFKKRYGIRGISVQGEKISGDSNASEDFIIAFRKYVEENDVSLHCIYNANKSGLFWKILRNKTLVNRSENQAPGTQKSKERVTITVCANASGTHKIPLLLIGKFKTPRCFRGVLNLPVVYKNQQNAWMDKKLMLEWYKEVFVPAILEKHGSEKKYILLLDNAPSHPPVEEFQKIHPMCEVIYLPPNVTSLIQPMDQGVIEKVKKIYKRNLLRLILTAQDMEGVYSIRKTINLHHCTYFVASAWNEITMENLQRAWESIFSNGSNDPIENSTPNFESFHNLIIQLPPDCQLSDEGIITWLQMDSNDQGWRVLSAEDIIDGQCNEENDLPEDKAQEEIELITPTHALEWTNKLMLWCANQDELPTEHLTNLLRVQNYIVNIKERQYRQ